jgi:hypothetical protein
VADQVADSGAEHRTTGQRAGFVGISTGSHNTSASSGANERAQHVARLDFLTTAARHREAEAQ